MKGGETCYAGHYFTVHIRFCELKGTIYPLDTGRKPNVRKVFRRRPGRLLNVLCRFNLYPVPSGYVKLSGNSS